MFWHELTNLSTLMSLFIAGRFDWMAFKSLSHPKPSHDSVTYSGVSLWAGTIWVKKGAVLNDSWSVTLRYSPYAFLTCAGFCCRSKADKALQTKKSIDLYSLFLPRKWKAHTRILSCPFLITAYLDLGFLNIVFSLSADWSTILCVPSFSFKTCKHLMFVLACILKKSVTLLLSQYYFHWALLYQRGRSTLDCLLTHFILICFLSEGFFLWCIFGVGSFLSNQVTFGGCFIIQRQDSSFLKYLHLWIQPNQYNLILHWNLLPLTVDHRTQHHTCYFLVGTVFYLQ